VRWCVDAYWSVNIVENKRDCHTVPPPISSVKGFKVWLNRPRFCDLLIPLATNWTGSWGERKPCKPFRCFVQRFLAEWKDGWMMLSRLGTHCFSRLYWKQPIGRWLQCWLGSVAAQYLPFILSQCITTCIVPLGETAEASIPRLPSGCGYDRGQDWHGWPSLPHSRNGLKHLRIILFQHTKRIRCI